MILYLSNGCDWTGTQADAKAKQGGKDFETIEVPTDKTGLMAFLQAMPDRFPGIFSDVTPVEDQAFMQPTLRISAPDGEYQNGDPTHVHLKSRNPAAVTTCLICGRDERAQKLRQAALTVE